MEVTPVATHDQSYCMAKVCRGFPLSVLETREWSLCQAPKEPEISILRVITACCVQVTIFWGLGGGVGAVGGGALGQWLYNHVNKAAMPLFTGITVASATIPMWWLTNANLLSTPLFFTLLLAVTGGMLSSTAGPLNKAMLLNVNEPETRGVALAWQTMTDDLGKGLGPAVVAAMISALGRSSSYAHPNSGFA